MKDTNKQIVVATLNEIIRLIEEDELKQYSITMKDKAITVHVYPNDSGVMEMGYTPNKRERRMFVKALLKTDLTQDQIAEKLGVSQSVISKDIAVLKQSGDVS